LTRLLLSSTKSPLTLDEHRAFYTALPFLVTAARDAQGRPWTTLLTGPDGFVTSPDPRSLVIDARAVAGDALEGALTAGSDIGILGIELATRRRNRVNGRVAVRSAGDVRYRTIRGGRPEKGGFDGWQRSWIAARRAHEERFTVR
jgi:predicted pyridoxine 5'-phosphate oxidase superfamily flavin-nucleotide-binding protein